MLKHTFTSKLQELKKKNAGCQKADGKCFLGHKRMLMVEFMQQGTTVSSEMYCGKRPA
jgi:hypothetical protein